MDLPQLLTEVFIASGSAGAGALGAAWKLATDLRALKSETSQLRAEVTRQDSRIVELERTATEVERRRADQWAEIKGVLGRLEGAIDERKSRPR